MKKRPFFSIVIPTYNRCSDLEFALYCILKQEYKDFEIVISDNCSTDNTMLVVKRIKDRRIRYSRTEKTLWNSFNIERAIQSARGRYVFLHSDDDFLYYSDSLKQIHDDIVKYNPGYIRVNYINLSPDKKRIFDFKTNKSFKKNEYIAAGLNYGKILPFILGSDTYFISGIVFKNILSSNIKLVDSDPVPWINILFFVIKKFGGYFISKPHIIASWSRRKLYKDAEHHVFTLINGKLRSENYLEAVKDKISKREYNIFLHKELVLHYARLLLVIKLNIGNKKMLQMTQRICLLDPTIKRSITYWINLIGALILPKIALKLLRDIYLDLYSRLSKVKDSQKIVKILKKLELGYFKTKGSYMQSSDPIFKF